MPQRPVPTAVQLIQSHRNSRKRTSPEPSAKPQKQKITRAPTHFSNEEKRAWKDIVKPLCDRGLWSDHLALWAENFAYLLATQRSDQRDDPNFRINRAQLRLYARDLQMMVECPDTSQGQRGVTANPFDDV